MKPLYRERKFDGDDAVISRAWMFMGEQGGPCDQKCQMCYYAHQDNLVFFSLETMIHLANMFRHYYGLDAADITGGEPTIYKTRNGDIVDLVAHCARIGLKPTIISHGQNNRDDFKLGGKAPLYKRLEDAGLEDWLISLHGADAESHDHILGKPGSFDRLIAGLDNVSRPVRFNTTLQDSNLQKMPVDVLKDRPPTVWNLINFNPFHIWSGKKEIDFQVTFTQAAETVAEAIETLEPLGWEVNVRYWPLCIARRFGFEANVSGYHQVPFDPWEWRLNATARAETHRIMQEGGWYAAERKRAAEICATRENDVCKKCALRDICDKPPEQYQRRYGLDELIPMPLEEGAQAIQDPLEFQRKREVPTCKPASQPVAPKGDSPDALNVVHDNAGEE